MRFELAQVNIARLTAPLDDPLLADFVAALDPVNAVADAAPGFVWRLQTEDGNATAIGGFEWDAGPRAGIIVNMSVWTDLASLAGFVYGDAHRAVLRGRRQWFEQMREAFAACWWVPAGVRPTVADAEQRIRQLRAHGVTPYAFTLKQGFPPPSAESAAEVVEGAPDWYCPA